LTGSFVELRSKQLGAFSRAQAIAHGITDKVLQGRCRARRIQRVYDGVYVDFTGPLPWETRVWAAWLAYGPEAALTGETALRWYGVDGTWRDDLIHLALPHSRRVVRRTGVVVSRHRDPPARLHSAREPATVRLEVAVLVTAGATADVSRQAAILLDACRQRRTTPERLLTELGSLPKLPSRRQLSRVLVDAADGIQSFLEQVYRRRVERPHRLPAAERQLRVVSAEGPRNVIYRDIEYSPYGLIVEVDGRAGHFDTLSRWRDMSRDHSAATSGKLTLRFGYQLLSEPCTAAAQVAAVLRLRGWPGSARPCSSTCAVASVSEPVRGVSSPITGA
jgi:hypothetical protein